MSGEPDDLEKLLASVADGGSVNWDELEKAAPDDEARAILAKLRLIAAIADVHRSQVDEVSTPGATRAVPAVLPGGAWPTARTHASASAPHVASTNWGHLRLVRKIGEGSYGEVYHAHDTWLDHPVALKLLRPGVESRVPPSDLLHEARKLVRVRHPNVVTVHGADRHDGRVGFWMDFIDGETLATRVARGRLSPGEAVGIGQEVCRALAAVHRANIIHRDVKAQNVMRAHDGGRIILMDFGAGQFLDEPAIGRRTQGTPLYLAPELLQGEDAGVRSDIYAAGVLLYHLVTGRFPIEASSLAALNAAHARHERRRLRDERPELPDAFIAVVERAVDPIAGRRYASAGEMHDALVAEDPGDRAPHIETSPEPPPSPPWLRPAAFAGGTVLAVFLGLTLVGAITSTLYHVAFGITGSFNQESPLGWPLWGLRSLLAPAILTGAAASAGLVLVSGVYRLMVLSASPFRGPVAAAVNAIANGIRESGTSTIASVLFLTQCAAVALSMWWFAALLGAFDALFLQTSGGDLTPLSPANIGVQQRYRQVLSLELFIFTAAWFGLLKTRFQKPRQGGWVSIGGGIAVTVLTLILLVVPYRILSHNEHERVAYASDPCYLLGVRGAEALLFCPLQEPPRNRVVGLDDPALKRGGREENMFVMLGSVVN